MTYKNRLFRASVFASLASALAFGCFDFGGLSGTPSSCEPDCDGGVEGGSAEASGPDLALDAPTTLTIQQGASTSIHLTVTRANGFTGAVTVTASGLPAGATVSPLTITSDQTTGDLTLAVDATTPQSLSHLSIDGVSADGKTSASAKLDLIVRGPPGSLDELFGDHGIALGGTSTHRYSPLGMTLDGSGNVLVSGTQDSAQFSSFAAERFTAAGAPDTTFGTKGLSTATFLPQGNFFSGIFSLATGKTLVAGTLGINNDDELARLTSAGALDPSFSPDGGLGYTIGTGSGAMSRFAMDANGSIVGVGSYYDGMKFEFYVARRLATGDPDPSFMSANYALGTSDSQGDDVVVQPDGKVLALVDATGGGFTGVALFRMTSNGGSDTGFAPSGLVLPTILTQGSGTAIALQPDGKILALAHNQTGDASFVARYSGTNGALDSSFGSDGVASVPYAAAFALQADGKIVVTGSGTATGDAGSYDTFFVQRLTTGGLPDPTFGNAGLVQTAVGGPAGSDARTIVIQPDGKIVVAGSTNTSQNTADFALTRYWP